MITQAISRFSLPWLLLSAVATLLATYTEPWLWLVAGVFMAWQLAMFFERARYPSAFIKTALVIALGALTWSLAGGDFNLENAVSFMVAASLLKLLEMRSVRDAYFLLFAWLFLLATGFLFKQSLLFTLYALLVFFILLLTLLLLQLPAQTPATKATQALAKYSLVLMLSALPLMLVLYLLFPRLGPLWSFALQSGQAKTGLSTQMRVGDITDLVQSDELVFRATFQGEKPMQQQLYWRALVLDYYDGRSWTMPYPENMSWFKAEAKTAGLKYEIIQEASHKTFLFSLGKVQAQSPNTGVSDQYNLRAKEPLFQRLRYQAVADFSAPFAANLSELERAQALQLPKDLNPKARALAQSLAQQYPDPAQRIEALLNYFKEQPFFYSLKNPLLGENEIDEFLFQTRRGFCAHYAGAMVFVLRSSGIPARVVTGYQGGQWQEAGQYVTVRQYDAHAWAEAWLDGRWVQFDPTVQVAPERILSGLEQALAQEGSFLAGQFSVQKLKQGSLLNRLLLQVENLNFYWQRWVLGYDQNTQQGVLDKLLGLSEYQQALYVLAGGFALFFVLGALWLKWQEKPKAQPKWLKAWQALERKAQALGVRVEAGTTPQQLLAKLEQARPDLAIKIAVLYRYLDEYLYQNQRQQEPKFRALVQDLTKSL